jgi:hypothetical protein
MFRKFVAIFDKIKNLLFMSAGKNLIYVFQYILRSIQKLKPHFHKTSSAAMHKPCLLFTELRTGFVYQRGGSASAKEI